MLDLKTFLEELEKLETNFATKNYLLAISGGADSMAMLNLFLQAELTFQVAHINYKLRGEESDSDQKLVEDYCIQNNANFHTYEVTDEDQQPKNSIQIWARKLRYRYFKKIQLQENLDYLITAHHLNDDLETFVINLSRGSGLQGLSGIPAQKNKILRPFLKFSKEEIYAYCRENNVPFREDASNKKNDYLRNMIRNEIVPKLLETNEQFLNNFQNSLEYLNQNKSFVALQISTIEEQLIIDENAEKIVFDKEYFDQQVDFVKFEILRKFGFDDHKEIMKIFLAETGKVFYSKNFQILINRNEIIMTKHFQHEKLNKEIVVLNELGNEKCTKLNLNQIAFDNNIQFKNQLKDDGLNSDHIWKFDCEMISLPLIIRHKKPGDFFYPTAMFGKKKVSKYFKDEKFSLLDKQEIWLLVDKNDEVLGILPYRQDRRFAATSKTIQFIEVHF